jgi:hypothetical protein
VIPKDAPASQWKEIENLSGFHVRMIDQALVEAEKQQQQQQQQQSKPAITANTTAAVAANATTNNTTMTITAPSMRDLVGHVIRNASIMNQAGAAAALQKESALDKYKRMHKAAMENDQPGKSKPVTRRRQILKAGTPPRAQAQAALLTKAAAPVVVVAAALVNTTSTAESTPRKVMTERQAMPTPTMNAHRVGTEAHAQRMEIVKKIVAASAPNKAQAVAQVEQGIVPFKILPAAEQMLAKIPLLRRWHVPSEEEELILDASLSFVESFRVSVFKRDGPLTLVEKNALRDWLRFVSIALPQEWGRCQRRRHYLFFFPPLV